MNKKYWFKNKDYGLGWTPANVAGWIVLAVHGLAIVAVGFYAEYSGVLYTEPQKFFMLVGAIFFLLLVICRKTGEPLKWQWGQNQSKKFHKK